MTVGYCACGHARQIHEATDGTLCRGRCDGYKHRPDSHAGRCTAKCLCDRFSASMRDHYRKENNK